jgi:hypothetical protein
MATTEQKRQKKLAKKRSKAVKQRRESARKRDELNSLAGRIRAMSHYPVAVSKIGQGAYEPAGMATVLFGRKLPDGQNGVAVFLVDLGCLGVKDCYFRIYTNSELAEFVHAVEENADLLTVPYSTARALVEQAVGYANTLGFPPNSEYAKLRPIFGDVDAKDCDEEFPFGGEDGKPLYISGPRDNEQRQAYILNTLRRNVGEGNFHFIIRPTGLDGLSIADGFDEFDEDEFLD